MANEVWVKSLSTITAQDNTAILDATYDPNSASYTGGTPEVIDQSSGENAAGAEMVNLELLVTQGAATDCTAEIWSSESEDGTNYTEYKYSHKVGDTIIQTTGGDGNRYDAGLYDLKAKYTKLAVNSSGDDIDDCTLYATPKVPEIQ